MQNFKLSSNCYQGSWGWHVSFHFVLLLSLWYKKNISQPPPKIPRLETQSYRQPLKNINEVQVCSLSSASCCYICIHLYNPLKCGPLRDKVQQCTRTISLKARPFWSKLSIRSAWSAATIFEREIEAGRYVLFFHRKTTFLVINFMSSVIRHIVQRDSAALLI